MAFWNKTKRNTTPNRNFAQILAETDKETAIQMLASHEESEELVKAILFFRETDRQNYLSYASQLINKYQKAKQ